ncbi:hypothetical protein, partial [uncultured Blautia sp.]|uniref:hypothetical protein n=1 Tax=uncultured Blautia sp. TaxID=765821 RepID=UPI00280B54B2
MKKHIFAICDPEAEYARNFMDYLNRKKNLPFEVQAFTGPESLVAYGKEHRIELLLIAEEAVCGELRDLDIGKIIVLTEGVSSAEKSPYAGVYKYQSSAQVVREVMACYGEEASILPAQSPVLKKTTEVLGIYSPSGRCLKTSFALTLGQLLGKNRPVLYLNMEEYSGFDSLFGKNFPANLSDLLYYVRQGEQNLTARINSMVQTVGQLDFIPPVQSPLDIRGTPWQDWICLIQEIMLHSPYETLILDIGNGIDEVFQILDMCGRIYMPVLPDKMSCCKLAQFENLLRTLEYPRALKNFHFFLSG